jgi:hypothetical protein
MYLALLVAKSALTVRSTSAACHSLQCLKEYVSAYADSGQTAFLFEDYQYGTCCVQTWGSAEISLSAS